MARSFNGSSDTLQYSGAVLNAFPLTMACWGYCANTTTDFPLVSLGTSSAAVNREHLTLRARGAAAGDPIVAAGAASGGESQTASTTSGFSANTWFHAAGVWAAANDRRAYLNGGNKGTSAGLQSTTVAGLNTTSIGCQIQSTTLYLNGRVCEVGIWNVALSDAEIAALAGGISPLRIQPLALIAYWPLRGVFSPEPDHHPRSAVAADYPMTVSGAASAAHAPVAPFSRRFWLPVTSLPSFYSLTASAGSYSLTGQAASLKRSLKVAAGAGSYSLTGQNAGLLYARKLTAGTGAFTLSGQNAALFKGVLLAAGAGSYVLTGQDASLKATRSLSAGTGTYLLTGQDVTLIRAKTMPAGAGSYSATGQAAALIVQRLITAGPGSYVLTGKDAALFKGLMMAAGTGSYVLSGKDVSFDVSVIVAPHGSLSATITIRPLHDVELAIGPYHELALNVEPG